MARPRTFDADAALDAALRVFWMRGYRGASLEELTAVSGGSRPSLYAAFGDKAGLFAAAVQRYHARFDAPVIAAMAEEPEARTAVQNYLRALAERFTEPDLPPGCVVALHAAAVEPEPDGGAAETVQACVAEADAALFARLRARLNRAKADGQLPAGEPLGPLANHFHGVRIALSTTARLGHSERTLRGMIDVAMRAWSDPNR